MKILIDINEHLYKTIKTLGLVVEDGDAVEVSEAIRNGTTLKGHGRLIDADELEELFGEKCVGDCGCCMTKRKTDGRGRWYDTCSLIDSSSTIIEADLEQEPCKDANANQHNSNALNDVGQHKNALEEDAISRQAVLALPRNKIRNFKGEVVNETINVTDIETLPSVNPQEQKPCEDCISRQAAIDAVNIGNLHPGIVGALQSILADLPPVTAQPKTGHWINVNKGKWNTIPAYKCSACGENADLRDWSGESPFCPWCGARMVEPQESDDNEDIPMEYFESGGC